MESYVYALILTAVMAAIAELLTDGTGASGAVRLVAGLCVLTALIQPLGDGVRWLRGVSSEENLSEWLSVPEADLDAGAVFSQQVSSLSEQAVADEAERLMQEKFGVPADQCRVVAEVAVEQGKPRIERLTVVLSGSAILKNPRTVQAYMEQAFGGECTVAVE